MTPQRLQYKPGSKGRGLPRDAVHVGPSSPWQHLFEPGRRYVLGVNGQPDTPFPTKFTELGTHDRVDANTDEPFTIVCREITTAEEGLDLYRRNILATRGLDAIRQALAGRPLACPCPPDAACHADVLLQLANGDAR